MPPSLGEPPLSVSASSFIKVVLSFPRCVFHRTHSTLLELTSFLIVIVRSHVIVSVLVYVSLSEVTFLGQEICIYEMLIHVAILFLRKSVSIYLSLTGSSSGSNNPFLSSFIHTLSEERTQPVKTLDNLTSILHTVQAVRMRNKDTPSLFTKFLRGKYINSSPRLPFFFFKNKKSML